MNKYLFAPGCALFLYKLHLVKRLHEYVVARLGPMAILSTCCHHTPALAAGTEVISTCPGCDRRYRENYPEPHSLSLWELMAEDDRFPFPDHRGEAMTIIDACPTRGQKRVHDAVRALAAKMNIVLVEPGRTREKGTCCGDTYYGKLATEQVIAQMQAKGREMPAGGILVYCVSCSKSMFVAGRSPRYLIDLLFAEETVPGTFHPDEWHGQIDAFRKNHQ